MSPNPTYLFKLINKSAIKEYIVKTLCTQQNWNTLESENIRIAGKIEHPAIVLENGNVIWNTAQIIYNHINKNITTGMYFKHSIVALNSVLDFIYYRFKFVSEDRKRNWYYKIFFENFKIFFNFVKNLNYGKERLYKLT